MATQLTNFLDTKRKKDESFAVKTQFADDSLHWQKRMHDLKMAAPEGASGFVEQLSREFGEYKATKIDGVSGAEAQQEYTLYLQRLESSIIGEGLAFQAKSSARKKKLDAESTFNTFAALVAKDPSKLGGDEGALQQLTDFINGMDVSSDQKAAWLAEETDKLYLAQAKGTIFNTKTPEEAEAFLNELDLPEWQEKLGDKWAGVKLVAQRAVTAREVKARHDEAAATKEKVLDVGRLFQALNLKVRRGESSPEEVTAFISEHQDSIQELNWGLSLDSTLRSVQDDTNGVVNVMDALVNNRILNHADPDTQKAVNTTYDALNKDWQSAGLSEEDIQEQTLDFIGALGVLPEAVEGQIVGLLNQDTSIKEKVHAAEFVEKLRHVNSTVIKQFNKQDISRAVYISDQKRRGVTDSMIEANLEKMENMPDVDLAERSVRAKFALGTEGNVDAVTELANGFEARPLMWFNTDIPPDLADEYEQSFIEHYKLYGDELSAKKYALDNTKSMWGYTEVGGEKRLSKHPVERVGVYGVPGKTADENSAWVSEQLVDHITGSGISSPEFKANIRDKTYSHHLVYNPAVTNNGLPVYSIYVKNDEGVISVIETEWTPEYMSSKQKVRDDKARARKLDAARNVSLGISEDARAPAAL